MSDLEYSDDKVRKLKDKLYYYHHLSSLNKRDKLDLNLIPESMLYFSVADFIMKLATSKSP